MADEQSSTTVPSSSAEDRKAASALANLDSHDEAATTTTTSSSVDLAAINKATKGSSGSGSGSSSGSSSGVAAYKNVKVDAADVALLVEELELPKPKATELLKRHQGDAVKAMRAYVAAA